MAKGYGQVRNSPRPMKPTNARAKATGTRTKIRPSMAAKAIRDSVINGYFLRMFCARDQIDGMIDGIQHQQDRHEIYKRSQGDAEHGRDVAIVGSGLRLMQCDPGQA